MVNEMEVSASTMRCRSGETANVGRDGWEQLLIGRQWDGKQSGQEQDTFRRNGRRWEQKPTT